MPFSLVFFVLFFRRSYYSIGWFIAPVISLAVIYPIPKYFEFTLYHLPGLPPLLIPSKMRLSKLYITTYVVVLNFIIQILVPYATLIVFNYKTYWAIKRSAGELSRPRYGHYQV